jgi:hypothetical protein
MAKAAISFTTTRLVCQCSGTLIRSTQICYAFCFPWLSCVLFALLVASFHSRVTSTYGVSGPHLQQLLLRTGADTVVYDIQDVGSRFYTFIWSLWDVMRVAAASNIQEIIVLDRPNPIGGRVRVPSRRLLVQLLFAH